MPPLTSGASMQAELEIPAFVIALVGCYAAFAFLATVVVLCLAVIENSRASHFPASDRHWQLRLPSCPHKHYLPSAPRGLALPVASIRMCFKCQKPYVKGDKAAPIPQGSVHSPATPSSYYARRGPTGIPQVQPRRGPPSSESLASVRTAPRVTTTPSSDPPLGYGARSPTAGLRPLVW